ncbi:MAG: hypothetical protein ACOCSE_01560 [Chitinivibrionales bacterium]
MIGPVYEKMLNEILSTSLNVLIYSEDDSVLESIEHTLKRHSYFNVYSARSVEAVYTFFQSYRIQCHCVILDAMNRHAAETLRILSSRPKWIPLIAVTDEESEYSFSKSVEFGQWSRDESVDFNLLAEDKEIEEDNEKKLNVVSQRNLKHLAAALLKNAFEKKMLFQEPDTPLMKKAMTSLFKFSHISVDNWAESIGLTSRKLQRIFREYSALSPKKFIMTYHIYRIVYEIANKDTPENPLGEYNVSPDRRDRVIEYVLSRRSKLFTNA